MVHLGQSHVATIHDQVTRQQRAAQDTAGTSAETQLERSCIDVGRAAIGIGIHRPQRRTEANRRSGRDGGTRGGRERHVVTRDRGDGRTHGDTSTRDRLTHDNPSSILQSQRGDGRGRGGGGSGQTQRSETEEEITRRGGRRVVRERDARGTRNTRDRGSLRDTRARDGLTDEHIRVRGHGDRRAGVDDVTNDRLNGRGGEGQHTRGRDGGYRRGQRDHARGSVVGRDISARSDTRTRNTPADIKTRDVRRNSDRGAPRGEVRSGRRGRNHRGEDEASGTQSTGGARQDIYRRAGYGDNRTSERTRGANRGRDRHARVDNGTRWDGQREDRTENGRSN